MREAILVAILIVTAFCILNSLFRVNNNEEFSLSERSALVFLIFLIPVLGFILTRKMKKVDGQ